MGSADHDIDGEKIFAASTAFFSQTEYPVDRKLFSFEFIVDA